MDEAITAGRPPEPDWSTVTAEELLAYRDAENRFRSSSAARAVTGEPEPHVDICRQELALPGRTLPVRAHRPLPGDTDGPLPLVLHVHGGGFVGTAAQSDWVNSHLAARLPAVVVSVDHRLLDRATPLSAAVDDGWDALRHVARWDVDPTRTAVFGESCGALICALAAIRAAGAGVRLRAQVLVNPVVDVTGGMLDHASATRHADSPTLDARQLRLLQRLAVPPGTDPRPLSPLFADDLGGLAPALVVVPTEDPLADQGRRYAERLHAAGTPARLAEYPGAGHAFLSMPGIARQAQPARAEILRFLRACFAPPAGRGAAG
ncbi:alpha/beta hydrolase [Saccharothrix algeriensis]|uniref:Acetyl esterase n=1 Tax=Saccharothrix algeriensis TaxID=173560 RepID=A0A8T8I141_9PSEU|nr:alpha/beta hydrolase [Saccharothrix algeriensis]MBM7810441.1 acetyl esterase [Saccharothrix algeriensis]QTR04565.1 alpha/beta hydrolase fold domain-containing protein [Saccharothrix algeriensis]